MVSSETTHELWAIYDHLRHSTVRECELDDNTIRNGELSVFVPKSLSTFHAPIKIAIGFDTDRFGITIFKTDAHGTILPDKHGAPQIVQAYPSLPATISLLEKLSAVNTVVGEQHCFYQNSIK